jgi:neutrophil cytosolic factor 2
MMRYTSLRRSGVKIHCDGEVRGMALNAEVPFLEFKQRVAAKFETSIQAITLKFRDEDGGKGLVT